MLLLLLLLIPLGGIFIIYLYSPLACCCKQVAYHHDHEILNKKKNLTQKIKLTALFTSIINVFISLLIFITFDFSSNQFQFVQEYHKIKFLDIYLGIDGISIYFVLLTTIIIPLSLLSN
jgi:NADH:ubiquinone oxidoreductase subunit 4 (subunit M)